MELLLFMGLGTLSLRALVHAPGARLAVVPGPGLGSFMGVMAEFIDLLRLGAIATRCMLYRRAWMDIPRPQRGR